MSETQKKQNVEAFDRPRAASREQFTTTFKDGELLESFAKFEVKELARILRYADNVEVPTKKQMYQYLRTLLYLRVKSANGNPDKRYKTKYCRVPVRFATLLLNIGKATDKMRNFVFVPATTITADSILSVQDFENISDMLLEYYEDGYATVKGLPKSEFGSIYLMAKTYISDVMMAMDPHHPVYSFLAAICEAEVTHDTYGDLNMLFRVKYSDKDKYEGESFLYFKNIAAAEQDAYKKEIDGIFNGINVNDTPEDAFKE